jgi:hypothetical protein
MSFKVSLCINTNTLGHSNLWDYYNLVYQRDVFITGHLPKRHLDTLCEEHQSWLIYSNGKIPLRE